MAYETGASTGPDDLLDKLRLFLIAQGWTVNQWADDTFNYQTPTGINGAGKKLHVQKTAADGTVMYFNFRSAIRGAVCSDFNQNSTISNPSRYYGELTGIAMNGSTGYGANIAKNITSIANWGGSPNLVFIYCTNQFQNGDSVTIAGTTDYNGTYTIANASISGFTIQHAWTSSQTGTATGPNRAWCEQPGAHIGSNGSWAMFIAELSTTAIPAYYFFADGDTVHVVVEYESGKYQFLSFGCLEKQGVYTGGQFFAGSYRSYDVTYNFYRKGSYSRPMFFACGGNNNGYYHGGVYLDVDSSAAWRCADYNNNAVFPGAFTAGTTDNYALRAGFNFFFSKRSPNAYNAMAAMVPVYIHGKRSNGNYSLLGWPKSIRMLNVGNYSGGQELTYGSETWKVFPADVLGTDLAGVGFAFKKVV